MTWRTLQLPPCSLGESPFWHPDEQRLYWVDIAQRCVHRYCPATGAAEQWPMPSEPGCIAPMRLLPAAARQGATHSAASGETNARGTVSNAADRSPGGHLLIALRDGVYAAAHWGGPLTRLAPALHDVATHRFNDGKADPHGNFWVSTLNELRTSASAQLLSLPAGAQPGRAALQVMATGATVGNGLAWSPDAQTLYWADTSRHSVRAWDCHARQNTLTDERIFKQWPAKPAGWHAVPPGNSDHLRLPYAGRPDGAAVDVAGNYYVAMYEGAQIIKLSAAGVVLASIAVPAQCPTMPCFGGDDGCTLYVTTARQNRPAAELQTYPDSGCVFAMAVNTPGLPVNFYAG